MTEVRTEPYLLPMFPLGSVLVPSAVLPLQVFEPRYLALIDEVRASEQEDFGVVLIERGSEVGGGDVRTAIGTAARLVHAEQHTDGRWAVVAVGVRRIRVEAWLDDDPYPRALVVDWPDTEPSAEGDATPISHTYDQTVTRLRQALGLAAELGDPVAPATIELSPDPVLGSFQVAALAPVGPVDQQALLAVGGAGERLGLAAEILDDTIELLRARLAMGGSDTP